MARRKIYSIPGIEIEKRKKRTDVYFHGRFVGYVLGDTFFKFVKKENIYRKWNSIGIEMNIIDYLRCIGVNKIRLKIEGEPEDYLVETTDFFFSTLELVYAGHLQKHLTLYEIRKINEHRWVEDWKRGEKNGL